MNQNSQDTGAKAGQNLSSSEPASLFSIPAKSEYEETLRLLARLEPPVGVADRVHYRLANANPQQVASPVRKSFWEFCRPVRRLQFAGGATLVLALAASTWGVYHPKAQPAKTTYQPAAAQGFGRAGTERRPATLAPINVPPTHGIPAHRKKPSASRLKRMPKPEESSLPAESTARP